MSLIINNKRKTTLINYFFKPKFDFSSHCQTVRTRRGSRSRKLFVILLYFGESKYECAPHQPPKTQTVFSSVLNIGIGSLRENSTHRNIRKILLGSTWVGSCPSISNQCTLGLSNQQARIYAPNTELEIIRFQPFPFRELVCHLIKQVNDNLLAAYTT